jgi:site-specific DNA-methyltransferase (cytosine-N4-specific)
VIKGKKPFYKHALGAAYLGDSLKLMKSIPKNSVNLILTSPPFALTSKKEYGNEVADDYVQWFLKFSAEFKRILKLDGSFVVDLGGSYQKGAPIRNIYQFELLVKLVREQGYTPSHYDT